MKTIESESNPFFDALMDAAVDAIIIIDGKGIIWRFNKSAQRLFEYDEDEVVGQNVTVLMPEPHRHRHDEYLVNYQETGKAAIIGKGREENGRRKSGEVFPMRLSVGETHVDQQVFYVGIIHDLSRRKSTEEKLRALEQQLFHADRLLTLGEMTAGIAHEINQPLTAIAAYADAASHLLDKNTETTDSALHDICTRIGEQTRRAAAVVLHLRELVRRGASKKALQSIINIIKNTMLLFDYEIKKHNIVIQIVSPNNLPDVYVNEIQIQQILVNLVKNSIDAIVGEGRNQGRIVLEIEELKGELRLSVSDDGPGVSVEALPRLFEPFYTSKSNGVGLGLSICKNIATAHGGSLAYSPSCEGACFILSLPLSSIG
ncbi:MAG TPA: PAS domain S-box protein [Xanthomonadales bacterium]|nr:PAS domain S-box protein [Xanthomonadales bacterium]